MHIRSRMAAAVLIWNEVYLTWFTDRSRDWHRQAVQSPQNDPTIKPEFMVDSLRDWHRWTLFLFHRSICEHSIKWVFYRLSKHHSIKEQSQKIILVRLNESKLGFQLTSSNPLAIVKPENRKNQDLYLLFKMVFQCWNKCYTGGKVIQDLLHSCFTPFTCPRLQGASSTGPKSSCKWFFHLSCWWWSLLLRCIS